MRLLECDIEVWVDSGDQKRFAGLALDRFENLIDDLGMQGLARMEGNNDSPFFFHVDSMTALASLQSEPALKKHILRFRCSETGQFRQPGPLL